MDIETLILDEIRKRGGKAPHTVIKASLTGILAKIQFDGHILGAIEKALVELIECGQIRVVQGTLIKMYEIRAESKDAN